MDKLTLAMLAGAHAIENSKRCQSATYIYDVFGDNPQELSYCEAARTLRTEAEAELAGKEKNDANS